MDKNTKILIIGRTGSGKSTIENYLCDKYGMTGIKSYTTRPQRGVEDNGHIFISEQEALEYINLVSSTVINGFKYFATEEQLKENDIYVIDVIGMEKLLNNYPDYNYIILHITVPDEVRKQRTASRTNFNFEERQLSEDKQFKNIEDDEYVLKLRMHPLANKVVIEEVQNVDFKQTKQKLKKIFDY